MRILIITHGIGKSPAGNVVKNILDSLCKINPEIEVISLADNTTQYQGDKFHELHGRKLSYDRLDKLFMVLTRKNLKASATVKKGVKISKRVVNDFKPEIVLVFSSSYGFPMLELGYRIAKANRLPLAIHAFDPVPSPPGWGEKPILRKAVIEIIRPYFEFARMVSLTNETMVGYQKKIIGENCTGNLFVLPNPSDQKDQELGPPEEDSFLYLGSIYGKRDPRRLIEAFDRFSERHKNVSLYLVGPIQPGKVIIGNLLKERIKLTGWTDDPKAYIKKCSVLIDLDANTPDDVFISSKLTNYIGYDRIILCITSENSPSRKFVRQLKDTAVVSSFKVEEIEKGLENALKKSVNPSDFKERDALRHYLSPENVANRLLDHLSKALYN